MATVLRVTDKRGRGIYTSGKASAIGVGSDVRSNRPMPWEDGLSSIENYERFGFKDSSQLQAWFWGDLGILAKHAQVRLYEVPDDHVRHGNSQLTFNRTKAKLIGIKNVMEV